MIQCEYNFLVLLAKVYVDVELCEGARSEAGTKPNGIIITRLEAIFYKLARPLRPISPTLTRDFILFYSYYYLFILCIVFLRRLYRFLLDSCVACYSIHSVLRLVFFFNFIFLLFFNAITIKIIN